MALVRTNRAGAGDTTARTTYTTASFSVVAGELIIAFFQAHTTNATFNASIPTLGGTISGITWTAINSLRWTTNLDRTDAWYGTCASSSTGTLTFTCSGAQDGAAWSVFTYTGHDPVAPVSAGLTITEGQPITGPIDVSSLTGSLTVWGTAKNSQVADGSHTGATTIHTVSHAAPTRLLLTLEKAGENAPAVTWGTSYTATMIAFKIREPAAVGLPYNVVVGGVKKTPVSERVIVGGVKKTVVNKWVIVSGVKKPLV
jgi:hypothetical protein